MKKMTRDDILHEVTLAREGNSVPYLEWADLSGLNLSHIDLGQANLAKADLRGANLGGAVLDRANLAGANLSEANLAQTNLDRANLTRADLTRADLAEAILSRANLTDADLTDVDLAYADLSRANLTGADLWRADLTGADLSGVVTTDVPQPEIQSAMGKVDTAPHPHPKESPAPQQSCPDHQEASLDSQRESIEDSLWDLQRDLILVQSRIKGMAVSAMLYLPGSALMLWAGLSAIGMMSGLLVLLGIALAAATVVSVGLMVSVRFWELPMRKRHVEEAELKLSRIMMKSTGMY